MQMRLDKAVRQVTIQSMNLNRAIRLSLLMLFALLQCVAPLAHAHVNGHHADHTLHVELSDASSHDDHDAVSTHLTDEGHHSAFVSMPPAYRFNVQIGAQAALVITKPVAPPCEPSALPLPVVERQEIPFLPYLHPFSQAPPA